MTEPRAEPADAGLVEPQGVNAAPEPPGASPSNDHVRSGGDPDSAEQMDAVADRDEIVGPPDQQAAGPGPGQELAAGEG